DVFAHVDGEKHAVWTEARGPRDRHRGAHTEDARFVGARGHDAAALGVGADDDGATAQLRAVALFDGGVERVHVDVHDRPRARHGVRAWGSGQSARKSDAKKRVTTDVCGHTKHASSSARGTMCRATRRKPAAPTTAPSANRPLNTAPTRSCTRTSSG